MSIEYSPNIEYLGTYDGPDGEIQRSVDLLCDRGVYGCSFFENDVHLTIKWYPDHNKYWAEDAAINYIEGRLDVTGSNLVLDFNETLDVNERIG